MTHLGLPVGRALVVALVASACALGGCGDSAPEEVETETVVPVSAEPARVGTIRAVVHATGLVSPGPGAELIVTAPEPARIVDMPKAEGDRVQRGEVLVRFEIPSLAAETTKRGAELKAAEARLNIAQAARTRAQDLFERGVAARREVEDAEREVSEAEAGLEQARAGLDASETLGARATVHATFDGIVAGRAHNPGDLVEPSAGDPVLRVIDPLRLEVHAAVPLADVPRVVVGATARLSVSPGTEPIALRVVSRPAAVEPNTASASVRLAFAAPSGLAVGTPVQVDIEAEEHTGVVLVPAEALVHESGDTAVFVASGDKAERRLVEVGLADAEHVEVRSGLRAGELVITRGQAGLPDGAAIALGPGATTGPGSAPAE